MQQMYESIDWTKINNVHNMKMMLCCSIRYTSVGVTCRWPELRWVRWNIGIGRCQLMLYLFTIQTSFRCLTHISSPVQLLVVISLYRLYDKISVHLVVELMIVTIDSICYGYIHCYLLSVAMATVAATTVEYSVKKVLQGIFQ